MSLIEIKRHLMLVKMATLGSLCLLFKTDADTMRCMLSHWINKGCVRQCTKKPACGTKCQQCPVTSTELYEWIEVPGNKALTCF